MTQTLIGTIQTLFVEQKDEKHYILTLQGQSIFLPLDETKADLDIGDYVKVFLYMNDTGQIQATAYLPDIVMDMYGWATVVQVVPNLGVFVSIGTTEDVLVSKDHLPLFKKAWPNENDKLYVTLGLDQQNRLLAIPATESQIEPLFDIASPEQIELNDPVEGTIYFTSKEGATMLTTENYRGFIHHTEREREPRLGQFVTGRVIAVKEDGTLNVSLLPLKHERIDDDAENIYTYLVKQGGKMPLNDRSRPEAIRETFNMSKSAFKRAVGRLMRERKVMQNEEGTFLSDDKEE